MQVANTILEQLGGGRFIAMTGARAFVGGGNSLRFRIPRTGRGMTIVAVTLDPADDTYSVAFGRVARNKFVTIEQRAMVYADQLRDVFTSATGYDTHL